MTGTTRCLEEELGLTVNLDQNEPMAIGDETTGAICDKS